MENKMTKTSLCLTMNNVKQQAKTLRNFLAGNNIEISHSLSLEALAKQHGLKDWNILSKFLKTNSTSEFPGNTPAN